VKRGLIAALACGALIAPSYAVAGPHAYSGAPAAKGGEASITARLGLRQGKPKRIVDFELHGLLVECAEDSITYGAGPLSAIRVKRNRTFSKNFIFDAGDRKLHVEGKINRAVTKISGQLRLTGDFPDATPTPLTACDSGVERFVLR
jgi:hypothetical protein